MIAIKCYINIETTVNKTVVIIAAINDGINFDLAYSITGRSRIVHKVIELSLKGEAKAPKVPLAKTAPITRMILEPVS